MIGIDVRETQRAAEDLWLYQAAIFGMGESVLITDADWSHGQPAILFVNPAFCAMTGFTFEDAAGKTLAILGGPKTEPIPLASIQRDLKEMGTATYQTVNYTKDGREQTIAWEIKPLTDGSGAITNYLIFQRDVSARSLLREQLQQAQKIEALGRVAGGIAHDFNNLLTVILGYAGLMALEFTTDGPPESKQLRSLIEIQKASEKAAVLSGQLLSFSRNHTMRTRVFDLNAAIANLEGVLRRLVGDNIDLELALGENLGTVQADAGQVEQVLMNLALNARDAMPHGGKLTLETRNAEIGSSSAPVPALAAGHYVSLTIMDTGIGMDEETRARVFEPFFTTKEPGRGTGLGLSMVQAFVKRNGGSVEVSSAPGMGARFTILLPPVFRPRELPLRDGASTETPQQVTTAAPARASGVILIVEDDAGIRELLRDVIAGPGYETLAAADAQQAVALALLHTGPIDLLLTDVVLPGPSGLDLAGRLVALQPHLRVLFVSGYADHPLLRQIQRKGEAGFIQKPFAMETLLGRISDLMRPQASKQAV